MGGQMTQEERQRWRQALRKAEQEELASIEPEPSEHDAAIADFVLARSATAAPTRRVAPLVSRRAMIGTGMLLAAGLAVALLPRRGDGPLPDYMATLEGDSTEMAPPTSVGTPHVKSDSLFKAVLQPAADLKGEIEIRVYVRQGEELLPATRFERQGQGVLRLKLQVRDLPGSREGKQEMVFVIARPGKLPSDATLKNALRSSVLRGDTWQLLQRPILVER